MPARFICPSCNVKILVPEAAGLQRPQCPNCDAFIIIPTTTPTVLDDPSSEAAGTTKATLLTKYKQDFSDCLKKFDEEPRKLVEAGRDFKALMECYEIHAKMIE